jgi:ABC-type antimicrobial peptide transport system permease subunit
VVEDAKPSSLRDEPSMQYYIPLGQERGFGGPVLLIRPTSPDLTSMAEPLRLAAAPLIPEATRVTVSRLQDAIDPQLRPWRLGAGMFGLFASLATLVAAVGLYSALAYAVARRQREMAIRRALGAPAAEIARRIIGGSATAVGAGSAIGLLVALLGSDSIQPLLFDNPARDPVVYAVTILLMLAITLAAAAAPTRKGVHLDARSVLRGD